MAWGPKGKANHQPSAELPIRVSMIGAVDTLGNALLAATTANVDSHVYVAFLVELIRSLDMQDPGWRETTVFLKDNSKVAKSDLVDKAVKRFGVPVLFLGQYGMHGMP